MKGPYERVKYDLRRVWECPLCNQRARTEGSVTSQFCKCQQSADPPKLVPMRLISDGIRRVHGELPKRRFDTSPPGQVD